MENFKHVFIFNIPEDVLKEELLEILERFGPVTSISIQKLDQETQVKYAIVEFQSHLIAFNAIRNLTGYIIKNHALNLYFFDIIEMKPVNIPPNYSPQSTQDNEIEQNKQNKQNEQNEQNKQNQLEQNKQNEMEQNKQIEMEKKNKQNQIEMEKKNKQNQIEMDVDNNIDSNQNENQNKNENKNENQIENENENENEMKQEENIESQQKNSENKVLDSIVSQLSSMTIEQIYNVMHKMKELVAKHPEQEKEKLVKNPQLSIALLQAQMVLGMINGISITDVPKKDIQKKIENLIQTVLSTWPQRDSSLNFEHQTPQKTSDNIKQKISKMDSIDDAKKSSLLFTDPTRSNLQANQNGISFLPSFNSSTHFPSQFPLQPNFNQNFSSLPSFLNPSLNVLPPLSANSFQVQKAQFQLFLKDLFSSPEKMNSLTNEQKEQLQLMMRYYQLN